jgi:diacylglycerol kinase (ATP)
MKPQDTGITRVIKALGYSIKGLKAAFANEAAFRQEIAGCAVAIPLAFWLDVSKAETALLIASVLLVLIVELLNSAIEAVVDRIGSEHHELSGRAKDIGSSAVLIALLLAATVWGIIVFFPEYTHHPLKLGG